MSDVERPSKENLAHVWGKALAFNPETMEFILQAGSNQPVNFSVSGIDGI